MTPPPKVEPAQETLGKLSLKQKIGQLMILGFSGADFRHSLKQVLTTFQPGAVIAFGRNVKSMVQVADLNRRAQSHAQSLNKLPLFIMVDQEGGTVARIRTRPPMPSALALGQTGDPELVRSVGQLMGELLATLGFNFNLAPVLDMSDPNRPSFIGNRAFGSDPALVTKMTSAFSQGLLEAHVVPTAKHFPGHGGITQDSHKKTPTKLQSLEELEASDLIPFKGFANLGPSSAVMVSHVAYPNIDDSSLPAAFSSTLIMDLLKTKLSYEGLVITDDLEMQGAEIAGGVGERAIKAIEAGCDMVMVAWSPKRQAAAQAALLSAVKSGRLTEERINASVLKIIRVKQKLKSLTPSDTLKEFKPKLEASLAALREVSRKVHRHNFLKSSADEMPEDSGFSGEQPFVVFTSEPGFFRHFKKGTHNPTELFRLTPQSLKNVKNKLANNKDLLGIYYATGTVTSRALNSLPRDLQARMYVINATYPGAIENPDQFRAVIQLNSLEPESGFWLAESLFLKPTPPPSTKSPSELREPTAAPKDTQTSSPPTNEEGPTFADFPEVQ